MIHKLLNEIEKTRLANRKLKMFNLINECIIKVIQEEDMKKNSESINECIEDILKLK